MPPREQGRRSWRREAEDGMAADRKSGGRRRARVRAHRVRSRRAMVKGGVVGLRGVAVVAEGGRVRRMRPKMEVGRHEMVRMRTAICEERAGMVKRRATMASKRASSAERARGRAVGV